jgi:hypothetical protein
MQTLSYAIVTTDIDGIPVLLGYKEWNEHILKRHPELNNFLDDTSFSLRRFQFLNSSNFKIYPLIYANLREYFFYS